MDDKLDDLIDRISILEYELDKAKLTHADSNVLSVAMKKVKQDEESLRRSIRLQANNQFDDMVGYFDKKIDSQYNELLSDYKRVFELFNIAIDKERECLLQYLGRG